MEEAVPQLVEIIEQRQEEQEQIPEETLYCFPMIEKPDPNREMPVTEIDKLTE